MSFSRIYNAYIWFRRYCIKVFCKAFWDYIGVMACKKEIPMRRLKWITWMQYGKLKNAIIFYTWTQGWRMIIMIIMIIIWIFTQYINITCRENSKPMSPSKSFTRSLLSLVTICIICCGQSLGNDTSIRRRQEPKSLDFTETIFYPNGSRQCLTNQYGLLRVDDLSDTDVQCYSEEQLKKNITGGLQNNYLWYFRNRFKKIAY